jgi:hypothetical protein
LQRLAVTIAAGSCHPAIQLFNIIRNTVMRMFNKAAPADTIEPGQDFQEARQRFEESRLHRRQLAAELAGAEMALGLADTRDVSKVSRVVLEKTQVYLKGRTLSADRIRRDIDDLGIQLAQANEAHQEAKVAWEQVRSAERARLVEVVRPRHEVAVGKIAALVEQLSLAVDQERSVRAELQVVGGTDHLPDAGREFGTLGDADSALSRWNRRLLAAGGLSYAG